MVKIILKIALSVIIAVSVISKTHSNTEWNEGTYRLHEKITQKGVDKDLGKFIINACKATALDPRKCVLTTVAIYGNESSYGAHCKANSCFGMISYKFKSKYEAADKFIETYNDHWFNHNGGFFFYGSRGQYGPSHFCTSEVSSHSSIGCPFGKNTFNAIYSSIYKT